MGKRFGLFVSLLVFSSLAFAPDKAFSSSELCGLIFEPDTKPARTPATVSTEEATPIATAETSRFALAPTRTCEFPRQYSSASDQAKLTF